MAGFVALGVLSWVTSEAGSAACLSLFACGSSKSWASGRRRGPLETLGRVRPGWVGSPGKPLVPLVFLSCVCGREGTWGLSVLSDVLLPLWGKCFFLLPELVKTALFSVQGDVRDAHDAPRLYGTPQWKHSSAFFRVDNCCFIAHIKIRARR